MRHHSNVNKLGLKRKARTGLMKTLAHALITQEAIQTTEAKAKALRPYVEKLVTHAKKGTLASTRLIAQKITDKKALTKITTEIAKRFEERKGGYTRIIKLPKRLKDASKMALIEFVK